ncbi:hypothetical protein GCM10010510_24550 [Streptomyces anandii JCM 4720]|nr:hypothetical protein GCM10010510_24550 [Streptomyces anandii JCM 4720]
MGVPAHQIGRGPVQQAFGAAVHREDASAFVDGVGARADAAQHLREGVRPGSRRPCRAVVPVLGLRHALASSLAGTPSRPPLPYLTASSRTPALSLCPVTAPSEPTNPRRGAWAATTASVGPFPHGVVDAVSPIPLSAYVPDTGWTGTLDAISLKDQCLLV